MMYALILIALIHLPPSSATCGETFGSLWQPSWENETRSDLRCKKECEENLPSGFYSVSYDKCCTCHSCMDWEGKEIDLYIEYVSVLGRSLLLVPDAPSETDVYRIRHTDSEMTEIPSNLCNWDNETNLAETYTDHFTDVQQFWGNIVTLNLENNKIRKLPDINCLVRLDRINLRNNRLDHLSNTSFTNLTHLRSLDFSRNRLQNIDPNILALPHMSVFIADFSHNEMTTLDVTNMMSLHPFCEINYESNKITELVNVKDTKLDFSKTYGPGFVSVNDNLFQTWPDFKELLFLDDLSQLGHLIGFGFNFQGMPIICDCNLEPFMTLAKNIIETVWRDYFNITCTAPENLKGIPVFQVDPALFICPLPAESNCQTPECTCEDKPNENTLYIDCSNSKLTRWPTIPTSKFSHYISLNLSGNQITKIENRSVLPKLSILDLSGNNIFEIESYVAELLENASFIDLSNNPNLKQVPQTFQYHNVCSRHMRDLEIRCDCDSVWLEEWLHSRECESYNHLFSCYIPEKGVKPARKFSHSDLECFETKNAHILETLIAGLSLILILTGSSIYIFRYEILIIYLRLRQKGRNVVVPLYKYDVILSFNDTENSVTEWVNKTLEPNLRKEGYRVFNPCRDVAFGTERNSEMVNITSKTRNFLVIMSESYFAEPDTGMCAWTENEWKYGWKNFKQDRGKNIVLINFDHVSSFDVSHLQIKAFLRVGCTVDFKNWQRNIMEEIYTKLGKPFKSPQQQTKIIDLSQNNYKPYDLFVLNYHYDADLINSTEKTTGHVKANGEIKKCQFRKCYACLKDDIELVKTPRIKVFKKSLQCNNRGQNPHQSKARATDTDSVTAKKQRSSTELQHVDKREINNLKRGEDIPF